MPKDYALGKKSASNKKARRLPPWWLWLVTGCLLVGLLSSLYNLNRHHQRQRLVRKAQSLQGAPVEQGRPVKQAVSQRYDFYRLLPKATVHVPTPESDAALRQIVPAKRVASEQSKLSSLGHESGPHQSLSEHFNLQVAAFKEAEPAEALRAQLLLQGFPAKVEHSGGSSWYKVVVGPYLDKGRALAQRQVLRKNHKGVIVVRSS